MIVFPDPSVETEYTDPNGSVWEFNGTGWVRQCASDDDGGGGGGGSHGDGMWPTSKLSSDLITIGKSFYEIADDGSVSLYSTIAEEAHNPEFCPTDKLVAVPVNSTAGPLIIYDYSTTPFTKIAEIPLPDRPSGCAWSSDGKTIMVGRYNKNMADVFRLGDSGWEPFVTNMRLAPDIDTNGLSPEEREIYVANVALVSAIGFGKQTEHNKSSFVVLSKTRTTFNDILSGANGTCGVITPQKGVERPYKNNVTPLVSMDGGAIPQVNPAEYGCRIAAHPNADLFAIIGVPVSRTNQPANRPEKVSLSIFGASLVSETESVVGAFSNFANDQMIGDSPSLAQNSPHALMFSPAGNYLAVQRQYSPIIIFRVHSGGLLSRVGEIDTSNVDAFFQWSSDEKFFYVRIASKLSRYDFNMGNPIFIDDQLTGLPTFTIQSQGSGSPIHSVYLHPHLNRSKA